MPDAPNRQCPACGASFTCDHARGKEHCWCSTDFPVVVPMNDAAQGCLCPACLRKRVDDLIARHGAGKY